MSWEWNSKQPRKLCSTVFPFCLTWLRVNGYRDFKGINTNLKARLFWFRNHTLTGDSLYLRMCFAKERLVVRGYMCFPSNAFRIQSFFPFPGVRLFQRRLTNYSCTPISLTMVVLCARLLVPLFLGIFTTNFSFLLSLFKVDLKGQKPYLRNPCLLYNFDSTPT